MYTSLLQAFSFYRGDQLRPSLAQPGKKKCMSTGKSTIYE